MTTGATADVVIAGAGPNGLMPACEPSLAGAGRSCWSGFPGTPRNTGPTA
jgi:hypothetical protein